MKYIIVAKFLGNYLPEEEVVFHHCSIKKSFDSALREDRVTVPVTEWLNEQHWIKRGTQNYIFFSQSPVSTRKFESEYTITTEIETYSAYDAVEKAKLRFSFVIDAFSIVARDQKRKLGNMEVRNNSAIYDYEILGLFTSVSDALIRLKLPDPLVSGRSFEPKNLPNNFLSEAENILFLAGNDPIFSKGLIYFRRANKRIHSGSSSQIEIVLNYVKCIELIVKHLAKKNKKLFRDPTWKKSDTKEKIDVIGKLLQVSQEAIDQAKLSWSIRSGGDMAHQSIGFNAYNINESHVVMNLDSLSASATEFLSQYVKSASEVGEGF